MFSHQPVYPEVNTSVRPRHNWNIFIGSLLSILVIGLTLLVPAPTHAAPSNLNCPALEDGALSNTIVEGEIILCEFTVPLSTVARTYNISTSDNWRAVPTSSTIEVPAGVTTGYIGVMGITSGSATITVQQGDYATSVLVAVAVET